VEINGHSLANIFIEKNISLADYFETTTDATIAKENNDFDKTFSENQNNFNIKNYPETVKDIVDSAWIQLALLSDVTPEMFSYLNMPNCTKTEQRILSKTKKIMEKAHEMKISIFNTLFSPSSPDFPSLQDALLDYLNAENPTTTAASLMKLGINDAASAMLAYRKARLLVLENKDFSPFYDKLSISIKESFKGSLWELDSDSKTQLLTKDSGITFIQDPNSSAVGRIATFDDLKIIGQQIIRMSSTPRYEIHQSKDVNLPNFNAPGTVLITFPFPGNPIKIWNCFLV
jgi:hypothetical protein